MSFYRDSRGNYRPVSLIRCIILASDKGAPDTAVLMDDREVALGLGEAERLGEAGHYFAAAPGWYVVCTSRLEGEEPDPEAVLKSPIIGWRMTTGGACQPITPDGINDGMDPTGWVDVMSPDGAVFSPGDRMWDSLALYAADPRHLEKKR